MDDEKRKSAGNKRLITCASFLVLGCMFLIVGWLIYVQFKPCNSLDIIFKRSGCEARTKIFGSSFFRLTQDGTKIVSLVYDRKRELDILDPSADTFQQIRSENGLFGGNGEGDLMDDIAIAADGKYAALVSGGYIGLVDLNAELPQPVWIDLPQDEYATRVAISPDGSTMAAAIKSGGDYVALYSIPDGEKIGELRREGNNQSVAYSSDGQIVTSFGGGIQFWDADSQTVTREFGENLAVHSLLFSLDGDLLAATTGKNYSFNGMSVDVFRVEDGTLLYQLTFDPDETFEEDVKISFSSDMLSAASCNEINLYLLLDGKPYRDFSPYHDNFGLSHVCLANVQFAPDGKSMYYAWGSVDSTATINKISTP